MMTDQLPILFVLTRACANLLQISHDRKFAQLPTHFFVQMLPTD